MTMKAFNKHGEASVAIFATFLALVLFGFLCWFYRARRQMVVWAHRPIKEKFKLPHFWTVELASILCGCYALTVTFTNVGDLGVFGGVRNPETGTIEGCALPCATTAAGVYNYTTFLYPSVTSTPHVVTRQVVANSVYQEVLLGISRFSGFALYPWIIMVFFTKFRGILSFLQKTPISVFLIQDTHNLHVAAGWYIFFDSLVHTLCHFLRWLDQGNLNLLWETPMGSNPSGRTGVLLVATTFIIVLPMTVLKKCLNFEMRKYAHYFFWVFCLCMTFHAPWWAWPNAGWCKIIFPTLMLMYFLDATYVKLFMTERIDTVAYRVLDSGVEVSMPVSDRFQNHLRSGGYGYVMFPWVSKHQWHAFSLYENPLDGSIRHAFLAAAGDWTKEVQSLAGKAETARPLWISGPFPSPYSNALTFDNMICVAAGIGITPAISAITAYKETRRVNLVWACRDASMLVFFLENAKLDERGFNLIFYTGKDPLPPTVENYNTHAAHLRVIRARPNLHYVLPNIIRAFHEFKDDLKPQHSKVMASVRIGDTVPRADGAEENTQEEECHPSSLPKNKAKSSTDGHEPSNPPENEAKVADRRISLAEFGADFAKQERKRSVWRTQVDEEDPLDSVGAAFEGVIPASRLKVWEEDKSSREYIKSTMSPSDLDRWGLLYCGSRNPLLGDLIEESKNLGISLHEEAFDW